MKNLKVSMKLAVSFIIVVLLALAVGAMGIIGMNSMNNADNALYNQNVVAISAMGEIREVLQEQRVSLRNFVINAGNSSKIREYQNDMTAFDARLEALFTEYEYTVVDESQEEDYFKAKEIYRNDFAQIKNAVREASLQGFDVAYSELYSPNSVETIDVMVAAFTKAMENNDDWAHEAVDNNISLFQTMLIIEAVILAIAVLVSAFLAVYISNLISKPLNSLSLFMMKAGSSGDLTLSDEDANDIGRFSKIRDEIGQTLGYTATFIRHVSHIADALEKLAAGDLSIEIEVLSNSDTLGVPLRMVADNMNEMFENIKASATQVSMGAKQVADGALSLAQGSTQQAASIQQLSSSIAEIASKTRENAVTAGRTSELSEKIRDNALMGSEQMD